MRVKLVQEVNLIIDFLYTRIQDTFSVESVIKSHHMLLTSTLPSLR